MCTPGYGITLDRFMRVAHLLPRQRGSVAVDDPPFLHALPWMCRTGAPWTMPSPDEGGLRSGAFAGRPASHRQAVRVEEEIVDAHREDAVLVADGFDHVAYEDDLLEAVVDLEQRGFSCATFSGVGSWYADWSGRRWRRPARRPGRRAPATCAARCACAAAR